jgi:O-antigen biosynthesis protein
MSDHTPRRGMPDVEPEILARLRVAEAQVELLESAVKSQESLANRLAVAMEAADQARIQLAQLQAAQSSGPTLRSVARRAKRRMLGDREHAVLPPQVEPMSRWSGTERVMIDNRYPEWIDLYDTLDSPTRARILGEVEALPNRPLISIVFPVFNAPEEYLRQAIESVRGQIYTNWELCISDDRSTEPHVAKVLDEYATLDDRIRLVLRTENGHISASSNSALGLARGEWICLMDHDDLLAEHALAIAVIALAGVPEAGLLYSDEDHVSDDGRRSTPYFKPDFDPLLILGQNYFSHLCMMRKDLIDSVGGFRVGVEGSQDWDLVLRILEQIRASQVVHVPHVLYHWRSHPASTASSIAAKPYVIEASRRVVQEHLDRIGVQATASTIRGSSFNRIKWTPSSTPPSVSIIVLPRSGQRFCRAIDSIRTRTTYLDFEIVVLDDGGFRPPVRQYLRDGGEWLTVIEHKGDGSDSAERNIAASGARGDVLCFLHDDVEVLTDSWLEELVGTLSFPEVGAVGAKLLYPDLTIQNAGVVLGIGGTVGNPHRLHFDSLSPGYFGRLMLAQCPSAVSWACMAVRREAFDAVGGFDEERFPGMFGDVDFCLRLSRAGWRTGWTPHAELLHFENPEDSRGTDGENAVRFARDIRMLQSTWGRWLENDPSYNPNLSLAHESFPLAWPPRRPTP